MSTKPLKNQRHEAFAQALALNKTADEAYQIAGYKPNRHNASRLKTKETISARVAAIQQRGADRAEITIENVARELAKIGFADIRKAVKWGADHRTFIDGADGERIMTNGVTLVESDDLDDATAAAISEVSQTKDGVKVKLHDKRAALVDLGRHLGMFKPETIQQNNGVIINITVETADAGLF